MAPTTDRRTVTRLDPETRRTQILAAAARVLERHDPVEVRFEEIAEAAGVSRGLLYNYFGDRGGLLAAVYAHNFDAVPDVRSGEPLHDIRESIAIRERAFTPPAPLEPIASSEPEPEPAAEPEPESQPEPSTPAEESEESASDSDDGEGPSVA